MIGRRRFVSLALQATALPILYSATSPFAKRRPVPENRDAPNILFITSDDVGWKDLSCYGNENIQTTHLDRLAAEGMLLENAFGVTSSCSSARASWMTGQYVHTHGVDGLAHLYPFRQLSPFANTLAKELSRRGYRTGIQGKWHAAPYLPRSLYGYEFPLNSVFDIQIDDTSAIKEFLRDEDPSPFYLELNFMQTHRDLSGHFEQDPAFRVDPRRIEVPSYMGLPDWPQIREDLALYYGQLLKMDALIGEVLNELRQLGLEERTVVLFVSDNGAPYPGNKMTLYDRGIGTPLLVRYPRLLAGGVRVADLVSTIDIMPTLLELSGSNLPAGIEGRSFVPSLEGRGAHRSHVFGEMNYHVKHVPMKAVRTSRWKYIVNLSQDAIGLDDLEATPWAQELVKLQDQPWIEERPRQELYDLARDPQEKHNLAGEVAHRVVARNLHDLLTEEFQ